MVMVMFRGAFLPVMLVILIILACRCFVVIHAAGFHRMAAGCLMDSTRRKDTDIQSGHRHEHHQP